MHTHRTVEHSRYSPEQLFALVADIAKYPEFLPWCRAARILKRADNRLEAELVIGFGPFTESYISEVVLTPPSAPHVSCAIDVQMLRGPFEHLKNYWLFMPSEKSGTEIMLDLNFKFRSAILDKMIGSLFTKACEKMASAFKERAEKLYG